MNSRFKNLGTKKIILLSGLSVLYLLSLWHLGRIFVADIYYNKALRLEKTESWTSAISLYEKAIAFYPKEMVFYDRLSKACFLRSWFPLGKDSFLAKAKEAAEKGLSLCAQNGELWVTQGMVWEALADKKKALASYDQAITLDPHNSFYRTARALFYLSEGREGDWLSDATY